MTETPKQDAPVYDGLGNVRPTDARYAGVDRVQLTQQELADIREAEIQRNTEIIGEQQRELQERNDKALAEATNSVLPTSQRTDTPPPGDDGDTELKGAELEQALKDRGLSTTGTADEKRARVAEYDAQQGA